MLRNCYRPRLAYFINYIGLSIFASHKTTTHFVRNTRCPLTPGSVPASDTPATSYSEAPARCPPTDLPFGACTRYSTLPFGSVPASDTPATSYSEAPARCPPTCLLSSASRCSSRRSWCDARTGSRWRAAHTAGVVS